MNQPSRILSFVVLGGTAVLLVPAHVRAQQPPPIPCNRFNLATEWKGTLTLTGTGSGTLGDGGTYGINETITAAPDVLLGKGAGTWTGTQNEIIHVDNIETHPDGSFSHVTGDETITVGPLFKASNLPGAVLNVNLLDCTFEFDFDPSFDATITSGDGVNPPTQTSSPQFFGFVGLQQSGGLTLGGGPGTISGPLPASGFTLSGSASISGFSQNLGDPGTWTVNWSFQPILDFDLIVTIPQYSDWRPSAGMTENDTGVNAFGKPNLLEIQALLINKSTGNPASFIPDKITFQLPAAAASAEPGVAMNWPPKGQLASNPPPDLNFDKNVPDNANFSISGNGKQGSITPLFPSTFGPVSIMLSPHDWGGWATLNVTATIGDVTLQGHFQGDPNTNILLPKRQQGSNIADIWKTQNHISLSTLDSDDSEVDPQGRSDCAGDGFTLYEEYRGFMENGKHIEGDPHNKDFFILNEIGADAEPGIFLFTELTGLTVHKDIQVNEVETGPTPFTVGGNPQEGTPLINFNVGQGAFEIQQHGVLIRTCADIDGDPFDGGETKWPGGTHAQPAIVDFICMQGRDAPGTLNPNNTHNGVISAADALLQYDLAVSHELLHSVGVLHHGDFLQVVEGPQPFFLIGPDNPSNTTGHPVFRLDAEDVQILDEVTEQDVAPAAYQTALARLSLCAAMLQNPSNYQQSDVTWCQMNNQSLSEQQLWLGIPHGKHSGNDQCVMRYPFAQIYPQSDGTVTSNTIFYQVRDGTEPFGAGLCDSPAGTGINDPNRTIPPSHPQPRYFDARPGRGACKTWICVNDVYPLAADAQ